MKMDKKEKERPVIELFRTLLKSQGYNIDLDTKDYRGKGEFEKPDFVLFDKISQKRVGLELVELVDERIKFKSRRFFGQTGIKKVVEREVNKNPYLSRKLKNIYCAVGLKDDKIRDAGIGKKEVVRRILNFLKDLEMNNGERSTLRKTIENFSDTKYSEILHFVLLHRMDVDNFILDTSIGGSFGDLSPRLFEILDEKNDLSRHYFKCKGGNWLILYFYDPRDPSTRIEPTRKRLVEAFRHGDIKSTFFNKVFLIDALNSQMWIRDV